MIFDTTIKELLSERLEKLEVHFQGDVIFFLGAIHPGITKLFRDFIEKLISDSAGTGRLTVFLNTSGGSAETVEKLVDIIRFHYAEVFFVVPDYAMSAGTIFCMSGDKIYMDYSSSLGPIDPQVFNGKEWVPALGYLDKVGEMLDRARNSTITQAEFLILQSLDLAMLSRCEQARDLTVTLLKQWLVQYKFKDWSVHGTDPAKKGQAVTLLEKQLRAEEVAKVLGDNKQWHSHGRMINADCLKRVAKLQIDDYSSDVTLRPLIRGYNDLLLEYVTRSQMSTFLHSKNFF